MIYKHSSKLSGSYGKPVRQRPGETLESAFKRAQVRATQSGKNIVVTGRRTSHGWLKRPLTEFGLEGQASPERQNPASVIPLKWTPARVRRNAKGQVQVAIGRKHAARR